MVDLGGFAPPSRTLFSLLHTAITLTTYHTEEGRGFGPLGGVVKNLR